MKTQQINSNSELLSELKNNEKNFVLIYLEGSQHSECTVNKINELQDFDDVKFFTVDVSKVKDIHSNYNVTSAPTILEFKFDKHTNSVKGCNTVEFFKSMIEKTQTIVNNSETPKAKNVIVYSTPSCSWCTRLKQYLDQNKIKYRDVDISKDQKLAEELVRKSGQQGVPQTEINGQIVVGFDKAKIDRLLEIK
jgi:glutaredoxin-like YruB-family protein